MWTPRSHSDWDGTTVTEPIVGPIVGSRCRLRLVVSHAKSVLPQLSWSRLDCIHSATAQVHWLTLSLKERSGDTAVSYRAYCIDRDGGRLPPLLAGGERFLHSRGINGMMWCAIITFFVSRRRRKMYCGHARLCICVSVRGRTPTLLHGPSCNLGRGRGCPLLVHYWADLQSVHRLRCYGNIRRTLVYAGCARAAD